MAITYDAPSNTITVTGYTEGSPCTFLDIWNADQAGGWGVVNKQNDVQFLFACKLVIGDGSTETWFADTEKQIVFADGIVTGNSQFLIERKRYAHIRYGVLEDADNKVTSKGVDFISLESTYNFSRFIYTSSQSGGETKLYSCSFDAPYNIHHVQTNRNEAEIYHCIFKNNVNPFGPCQGNFYDIISQNIYIGFYATGTMERILLGNHSTAALYARFSPAVTVKNVVVKTPYGALWYLHSKTTNPVYAINVDAPTWSFTWGGTCTVPLYRQYEFDVHCQDKEGNDLGGVSIVGEYISPYGQAFSETSDGNGDIPTQTVDHGFFDQANGSTEQLKTPLKVTYSKPGYQTVVKYYDMDEKTKDRVVLHKAVGVFLDFGRPVINLNKTDPENRNVIVL